MLQFIILAISIFCGLTTAVMGFLLSRTINENDRKIDMIKSDLKDIEREVRECKNALAVTSVQTTERLSSIADKLKDLADDKRSNPSINNERNKTRNNTR